MTPLLLTTLVLLALYGVYMAARVARLGAPPDDFLDAGATLPGWSAMFLLPGLVIAGMGIERHLGLVARFGLQASHVGLGVVLAAMMALLAWNRIWYVARIGGFATPGEALGRVYGSVALRIIVIGLAILFGLPFAADILSFAAMLLERATDGLIPRSAGVWLFAFSLAVPAIIGGWRATVLTLAMQSLLLVALIPFVAIFAEVVADGAGFPTLPIPVLDGVLWDRIPGVVQFTAGIGKEQLGLGIFSAVAISTNALALLGIVLSPAALFLGSTVQAGRSLGVSTVWLTSGLAAGLLLFCAPLLATRVADDPVALAGALHLVAPLSGVALVLMLLNGALLAVSFFVTGSTMILTRELILTYLLPDLGPRGRRLAARISLGIAFFFMAFMAGFMPLVSAVIGSIALPLAVQLLPALMGLTLVRWIGRGAILAGFTLGALIVVFTEPPGLILFEGLIVELPWGRWPLTIHSAAWGLAFNLLLVVLSATVTQRAPDRFERDRLHDALDGATRAEFGGRGLLWAPLLLWSFFGYGPGAVLGNRFFSDPIFSPVEATLGIPSLWVWQLLFWLLGVVLVWWLAYRVGLGALNANAIKPITIGEPVESRAPKWLAQGLRRIRGREAPRRARGTGVELISRSGPPARRGSSGSAS